MNMLSPVAMFLGWFEDDRTSGFKLSAANPPSIRKRSRKERSMCVPL